MGHGIHTSAKPRKFLVEENKFINILFGYVYPTKHSELLISKMASITSEGNQRSSSNLQ